MVQYRKRIYDKERRALNFWILAQAKRQKALRHLGGKCNLCDETRHYVLSFHHIKDKKECLGNMFRSNGWDKILLELEKCELLCENCHRESHTTNKETKNKAVKEAILKLTGGVCKKCGYNKSIKALEFHHTDKNKEFKISDIRNVNDVLLAEIKKCQLLCACCHREMHFDSKKFERYKKEIIAKSYNLTKTNPAFDRDAILAMHQKGLKQAIIAKEIGCSPSVVCQVLKEHLNFYVKRIDDEEVKELYKKGINPHRISKKLGFSRTTVMRSLNKTGVISSNGDNK